MSGMKAIANLVSALAGIAAPVMLLLMVFNVIEITDQSMLFMISLLMVSNSGKVNDWER